MCAAAPYHQLVLTRTSHTCCSSSMALTSFSLSLSPPFPSWTLEVSCSLEVGLEGSELRRGRCFSSGALAGVGPGTGQDFSETSAPYLFLFEGGGWVGMGVACVRLGWGGGGSRITLFSPLGGGGRLGVRVACVLALCPRECSGLPSHPSVVAGHSACIDPGITKSIL